MASGLDMNWYTYVADDGNTYSVKVDKTIGDNTDFAFGALDATKPILPKGARMRAVYAISADGNRTKRPVGAVTGDIWTGTATTFTIPVRGSATARTFTVTGKVGERKWHTPHTILNL